MVFSLKSKLQEYRRVLKITRKPTGEEFKAIAKVAAIGILVVGAVGFVVHLIAVFIQGG